MPRRVAALVSLLIVACGATASPETASAPAPTSEVAPEAGAAYLCGGFVLTPDLAGARDVGGLSSPSGALACGKVLRGPRLSSLGSAGCAELASRGIRTIVDLREASEREALPDASCAQAARTVLAPLPIPYSLSAADYVADLETDDSLRLVFQTLAAPETYPVYVHCTYGRDRTGVVVAVLLRLLGVSREDVMAEYQRTATAGLSTSPSSLAAVLDRIEATGGAEARLARLGLDPAAIARIRAVMQR